MSESYTNQRASISLYQGNVIDISDSLILFAGYDKDEFVGKDLLYVLKKLLRISKSIDQIEKIASIDSCFIFNKQDDFQEVCIIVQRTASGEIERLYLDEMPLIGYDNPFSYTSQLISDNLSGIALFTAEEFILLKASKEYVNISYRRHKKRDIIGKKAQEFFVDFDSSPARQEWENAIKTRKTCYLWEKPTFNHITKQMEYYDSSVTPIIVNGEVKYLVASLNDVTDKVKYRNEISEKSIQLQKQKELLEAVIENQKDSIFIVDKNCRIVNTNKTGKERFSKAEMTHIRDLHEGSEIYDEMGRQIPFEQLPANRVIRGEVIDSFKLLLKRNGKSTYIDLNGTPIYDENGDFDYAFLCGTDITEIVESKQQLISQKEQLEAIMDNMSDALFIIDADGYFIIQNKEAKSYFGKELKHINDRIQEVQCFELDGTPIPINEFPILNLHNGIKLNDRVYCIKFPEKQGYFSISTTPVFNQEGKFCFGVLSSRDITQWMQHNQTIKEQQQALLQAEKREKENLERVLMMKDEFLSLISHEFKTPMTVINSALQAMELLCKDQITGRMKTYLDMIKKNTYRQLRLVNNLLDITRANAGYIKLNKINHDIVFLTKSLVDSVNLYAQQKGINIVFKTHFPVKLIALDEEKYERILFNLLSNAIKFTQPGKSIKVEISYGKGKVVVAVIDEGIGIPKDKQDIIFERFGQVEDTYTRQAEGSGIGLSLVKLFMDAMGGWIRVESEEGQGSSFFVELPDILMPESDEEETLKELIDTRLIQSIAIELSDIYF